MILYTEEQLEAAYKTYRMLHARNNVGFIKLEEFRVLFENISVSYTHLTLPTNREV